MDGIEQALRERGRRGHERRDGKVKQGMFKEAGLRRRVFVNRFYSSSDSRDIRSHLKRMVSNFNAL